MSRGNYKKNDVYIFSWNATLNFAEEFPELVEIATTTRQIMMYRFININIIFVLNRAQYISSSLRWYSSNRSNTRRSTSSDFKTPREELKIRDEAKYVLTNFEVF